MAKIKAIYCDVHTKHIEVLTCKSFHKTTHNSVNVFTAHCNNYPKPKQQNTEKTPIVNVWKRSVKGGTTLTVSDLT